jgi:hypothetical protein
MAAWQVVNAVLECCLLALQALGISSGSFRLLPIAYNAQKRSQKGGWAAGG